MTAVPARPGRPPPSQSSGDATPPSDQSGSSRSACGEVEVTLCVQLREKLATYPVKVPYRLAGIPPHQHLAALVPFLIDRARRHFSVNVIDADIVSASCRFSMDAARAARYWQVISRVRGSNEIHVSEISSESPAAAGFAVSWQYARTKANPFFSQAAFETAFSELNHLFITPAGLPGEDLVAALDAVQTALATSVLATSSSASPKAPPATSDTSSRRVATDATAMRQLEIA